MSQPYRRFLGPSGSFLTHFTLSSGRLRRVKREGVTVRREGKGPTLTTSLRSVSSCRVGLFHSSPLVPLLSLRSARDTSEGSE